MGIITFLAFILGVLFIDEFSSLIYRGGLFVFSLNTAILIGCIIYQEEGLSRLLSSNCLRWIGTRSFGIYLWHYPIMALTTPIYEIGNLSYLRVFVQLILTCIFAELSYRIIEKPLRNIKYRDRDISRIKKATVNIVIFLVIIISTISIPSAIAETPMANARIDISDKNPKENEQQTSQGEDNNTVINSEARFDDRGFNRILAIGDSVILNVKSNLKDEYEDIIIDGEIGRQMSDAIKLAHEYKEYDHLDNAVIIQLGTNGYFTEKHIDELLDFFSKAQVFLINTRVPRAWESKVNKALKEKADEYDNVTLVDWHSLALEHPEYFEPDGVHLNLQGSEALASLIIDNIDDI